LLLAKRVHRFAVPHLQHVFKTVGFARAVAQSNRVVERGMTEVHVPLCRRQILVPA